MKVGVTSKLSEADVQGIRTATLTNLLLRPHHDVERVRAGIEKHVRTGTDSNGNRLCEEELARKQVILETITEHIGLANMGFEFASNFPRS